MKERTLMLLLGILIIGTFALAFYMKPAKAQEIIVGTVGDAAANLVVTPVGELTVVSGVIGDEPVNIVTRTEGRLVARIQWVQEDIESLKAPPEIKEEKEE